MVSAARHQRFPECHNGARRSRREQPADDVPAAGYVITRDEIRRSGLTSIPELLRLAPGVQVARINSNKWAVSVRGFNGRLYSNKLLVMIDGRSIYNPAFSTVLWDTERPPHRRHRSHRGDPGSGRSDVGRQCRQRRHQHHHALLDTDERPHRASGRGQLRHEQRGVSLRRLARRRAPSAVHAGLGVRRLADRGKDFGPTTTGAASRPASGPT